jgi:hypothetical protein
MTLTSIMPTFRRTLPDPIRSTAWPEHTHATTTDVVVAGVSMLRLAELCQTPCVHTDETFAPGTRGRRAFARDAAVVVARVTGLVHEGGSERIVIIDARLDEAPAIWDEARLIGRVSTVSDTAAVVLPDDSSADGFAVHLPADLREGDLLAIPCAGMVLLRDIHSHRGVER